MADDNKLHHGHRKRMKTAMLEHGIEGLNEHQVLEMLLFFGVPKGDTNPTAHRLIDRFGSLRGVLEADYDELLQVTGIGENVGSLIKFVQLLSGRYLRSASFEENSRRFGSIEALQRYYEGVYLGSHNEQLRAMLLDDNLYMIKEQLIAEGTIGKSEFSIRKIADFVIKNSGNRVVIAHNHPNGLAVPSKQDIVSTVSLLDFLKSIDVELVDHIIVGRTGSMSMRKNQSEFIIWDDND